MWDLPGPGPEPMSPALAGRFLTTAPPGKSLWIDLTFPPLLLISALHAGQFHQIHVPIILPDFKFLLSFFIFQKLFFSEFSFFIVYCYCLIECNISYLWVYEWLFFLKCSSAPYFVFPSLLFFYLHWSVFLKCLVILDWPFIFDREVLKKKIMWCSVCMDWGYEVWVSLWQNRGLVDEIGISLLPQYL